jgi:hypothetical protein
VIDSEVENWVANLDARAEHLRILCAVWYVLAQDVKLIEWIQGERNSFIFSLFRQSLHKDIVSTIYTFLDDTKGVVSLRKFIQKTKGRAQKNQFIWKEIDALTRSGEFTRLEGVRNNQIGHAGSNLSDSQVGDVRIVAEQIFQICRELKLIYCNETTNLIASPGNMDCSEYWRTQVRKQFGMVL